MTSAIDDMVRFGTRLAESTYTETLSTIQEYRHVYYGRHGPIRNMYVGESEHGQNTLIRSTRHKGTMTSAMDDMVRFGTRVLLSQHTPTLSARYKCTLMSTMDDTVQSAKGITFSACMVRRTP